MLHGRQLQPQMVSVVVMAVTVGLVVVMAADVVDVVEVVDRVGVGDTSEDRQTICKSLLHTCKS